MNKTVNYGRLIDDIYYDLCNTELNKNVIETEELQTLYHNFCDDYIESANDDMFDRIAELVFSYCRRGFDVGFRAALVLMQGDVSK